MSILLGILSGLFIVSGVAIVNHLLGQRGENKRWEQHEKSLRRQWEREQRAQRERWDREDRTRFQSERLKAYRDIHKAADLENLGLCYYRFSNDYKFNSEQLARGLEELHLCHSEILLISYSDEVRNAAGRVASEAIVLSNKLLSNYEDGDMIDGLWLSRVLEPFTPRAWEFIEAVRREQGMEDRT